MPFSADLARGRGVSGSSNLEAMREQQQRLVYRCVAEFLLDQASRMIRRHDGNFIRAVIFLAIGQATREVGPQARAISVRAIALSLGLAYETTRRQVLELEAAGYCVRVGDRGVAVNPALLASEPQRTIDAEGWMGLTQAVAELKGLGFDFSAFGHAPVTGKAPPADPIPVAGELIDGLVLRVLESGVGPHGSMLDTLVYVALVNANASAITYDPTLAWMYSGRDSPPPDALRRAVSIGELARRLSMPRETARRRLAQQVKRGRVVPVEGGYLADMTQMQTPEILHTGAMAVQRFMQTIQALRQLGLDVDAIAPVTQPKSA